jgi:hypothetical protein
MDRVKYRPIVLFNLLALRTTVYIAEWALRHRRVIDLGKEYAPVALGSCLAYYAGRVVGQAILYGLA